MKSPLADELDAELLYAALLRGVQDLLEAGESAAPTALVGIWSGGAWLAARPPEGDAQKNCNTPVNSIH